jgi:hypothetical protein
MLSERVLLVLEFCKLVCLADDDDNDDDDNVHTDLTY